MEIEEHGDMDMEEGRDGGDTTWSESLWKKSFIYCSFSKSEVKPESMCSVSCDEIKVNILIKLSIYLIQYIYLQFKHACSFQKVKVQKMK